MLSSLLRFSLGEIQTTISINNSPTLFSGRAEKFPFILFLASKLIFPFFIFGFPNPLTLKFYFFNSLYFPHLGNLNTDSSAISTVFPF